MQVGELASAERRWPVVVSMGFFCDMAVCWHGRPLTRFVMKKRRYAFPITRYCNTGAVGVNLSLSLYHIHTHSLTLSLFVRLPVSPHLRLGIGEVGGGAVFVGRRASNEPVAHCLPGTHTPRRAAREGVAAPCHVTQRSLWPVHLDFCLPAPVLVRRLISLSPVIFVIHTQ